MRPLLLALALLFASDDALKELYESGQTYAEFLDDADRRRAMWLANTEKALPSAELIARARGVEGSWYLLAVAVDGCSDSANTIPYIAALVDSLDHVDLRIVPASEGRFLMQRHRTPDDRAATPTVVLLDKDFEDAGAWVERPAPLQVWATAAKDSLSSEDFLAAKFRWYDEDIGRTTVEEVVSLLETAAGD